MEMLVVKVALNYEDENDGEYGAEEPCITSSSCSSSSSIIVCLRLKPRIVKTVADQQGSGKAGNLTFQSHSVMQINLCVSNGSNLI